MVQIIPAILSTSEDDYARDVSRYQKSSFFQEGWVHIDFMDNIFVPNKSIEPPVIAKHPINLHKEAHPMVLHPLQWVDSLVKVGFERIIFHIEAADTSECIEYIKSQGLEVGLAINNKTPMEKLTPFIAKIDVVLVMSIIPGFQGQPFIHESLDKIRKLKSKEWKVRIGIDGAVKDDNIREIVDAGVDFITVGSYLLKGDIDENLEKLWEVINE
ncbi:ribulose-phosphate 3-epimerase [Candidatus Daviesbacteria bacterium]|nr:ribulose-phosphate 3-epimerase [Candidatus Daviesbacteria bacterium]